MRDRQVLPRVWLVTDERMGAAFRDALARLPERGGILFRHYSLGQSERRRLFDSVRGLRPDAFLLLAGPAEQAMAWGADGWHGPGSGPGLHSASVHDRDEILLAEASGADLLFLSPVFATRSHPGAVAMGPDRFAALAAQARAPVIALGGMDAERARITSRLGAHGWAAIDAWLG